MATDRSKSDGLLVGVMVDVSSSMKNVLNLREQAEKANMKRSRKLFQVVSNVAHRAARPEDRIAVTAFGTQFVQTCDLLQLLAKTDELLSERGKFPATRDDIDNVLRILEENGAGFIRDWIERGELEDCVRELQISHETMARICEKFKGDAVRKFIEGLPQEVRNVQFKLPVTEIHMNVPFVNQAISLKNKAFTTVRDSLLVHMGYRGPRASRDDILHHTKRAVVFATSLVLKDIMLELPKTEPWRLTKATELFRSLELLNDGKVKNASAEATDENVTICIMHTPTVVKVFDPRLPMCTSIDFWSTSTIVDVIEPCIYARTPMCTALQDMSNVFQNADNNVLFIVSDGESTDGDPRQLAAKLKKRGVTIASCLLTNEEIRNPRQLFGSNNNPGTNNASCAMYDMSSSVSDGTVAIRMLARQGWKISTTGESRLFVQANHSEVIDEFVSLVGRLLCSNDVLLDYISRVPLDSYVQDCRLSAQKQVGGTCYANAIAAVYHMAMTRIHAREGGVPGFKKIRDHIIEDHCFGYDGANVVKVLEKVTSDYRLHFKEVDETGAREALNLGHPVVTTFVLKDTQWSEFSKFFKEKSKGVLDVGDISTPGSGDLGGHAVVFIGYDKSSMKFMNSWGEKFADKGFFRIRSAQVLSPNREAMRFFHVFWYESELTDNERMEYRMYGEKELKKWANRFNSALQILDYECPKCGKKSALDDFEGDIFHATCPRCRRGFTPQSIGYEFLTNIYLRQL